MASTYRWARIRCRTPWYPLGNGNMMIILDYVLHLAQMMSFAELDDALKFPTVNGATTMHLGDGYGIAEGRPANFIVLDATTPFEAVYGARRCGAVGARRLHAVHRGDDGGHRPADHARLMLRRDSSRTPRSETAINHHAPLE